MAKLILTIRKDTTMAIRRAPVMRMMMEAMVQTMMNTATVETVKGTMKMMVMGTAMAKDVDER